MLMTGTGGQTPTVGTLISRNQTCSSADSRVELRSGV